MCCWDIIGALYEHANDICPELDVKKVNKKKFRERLYERILFEEILTKCCDRPYNSPIDILWGYEITYEVLSRQYKDHIYKAQLNMVRKLIIFVNRWEKLYG